MGPGKTISFFRANTNMILTSYCCINQVLAKSKLPRGLWSQNKHGSCSVAAPSSVPFPKAAPNKNTKDKHQIKSSNTATCAQNKLCKKISAKRHNKSMFFKKNTVFNFKMP